MITEKSSVLNRRIIVTPVLFVTMLNKLAFLPLVELYIEMLATEDAEKAGPEIAALKIKEKYIVEERDRLTLLLQKGCGEPVLFRERLAALDAEEAALRKGMERLQGESHQMGEANWLKKVLNDWKAGRETDADRIFTEIADCAAVNTGEDVTFHLKCGLKLREALATREI